VVPPLLKRVSVVAFPPSASNFAKIAQFGEVMKKMRGVGRKWVQCSMMGELKQIKIFSTNFLIVASCF
jgi:hypothetical protein